MSTSAPEGRTPVFLSVVLRFMHELYQYWLITPSCYVYHVRDSAKDVFRLSLFLPSGALADLQHLLLLPFPRDQRVVCYCLKALSQSCFSRIACPPAALAVIRRDLGDFVSFLLIHTCVL